MRALALLLGLMLVLGLAGCSPTSQPQFRGGPKLSVEPAAINFGAVPAGTTVKTEFTLKNVGDAPLTIERAIARVTEGCCPPQPVLSQSSLAPGKKATLSLEIKMASDMAGPHRFEVVVYSNDALTPMTVLEVKGEFLPQ